MDDVLNKLRERVKELTALHKTARILQDSSKSIDDVMKETVALLPDAWQYPEITVARIRFGQLEYMTDSFIETQWGQTAPFATDNGQQCAIEVYYLESRALCDEGPFLKEERELIDSLAEMLQSYFRRVLANNALKQTHDNLEKLVNARTVELQRINTELQTQIAEYQKAESKIANYQKQLRQLASELSLIEARERRAIASDLHDHIGQALAFIKINISQLRGNAIFCGFDDKMEEIITLLDGTIQYTRNLTFEISPPVLYELGLEAAIKWLADQFKKKHGLNVKVRVPGGLKQLDEEIQVTLFKSIQEILTNVAKHAQINEATIALTISETQIRIEISDKGCGFDSKILDDNLNNNEIFGLFNIRERLNYLGGSMSVESSQGKGTRIILIAKNKING
jgi:signal transduction histidine kinase